MTRKHLRVSVLVIAIVALFFTTGCGPAGQQTSAPAVSPEPTKPTLTHVKLQLGWVPQWQFAGYLVAAKEGFFTEEGLEVEILPGGPESANGFALLGTGQVDFYTPGPAGIWNARVQGIPVVGLLTIYQRAPYSYMVLADSGIKTPMDFAGKKVMIYDGDFRADFEALATAVGLDTSTVTEIPGTFDISPLLTRQVDVLQVYATDEPEVAREQGYEVNLIWSSDYGITAIGDCLVTNEMLRREHPEVVQAFVNASMRGWIWAMQNVTDTYDLIISYNDQLNRPHLAYEASVTIQLMTDYGTVQKVGWNYQDRWDAYQKILIDQKALPQAVPFSEAVDNSFVEKFYAQYKP